MARHSGLGPGAKRSGGLGRKPGMMPTPMATAPIGPPGGLSGSPVGPSPGSGSMGIKKGGHIVKHARGGAVEGSPAEERRESKAFEKREDKYVTKHASGGMAGETKSRSGEDKGTSPKATHAVIGRYSEPAKPGVSGFNKGGEVKARVRAGGDHC